MLGIYIMYRLTIDIDRYKEFRWQKNFHNADVPHTAILIDRVQKEIEWIVREALGNGIQDYK